MIQKLLDIRKASAKTVIDESQELTASFSQDATETLSKFNEFKTEMFTEFGTIYETIGYVKKKLAENVFSKET